MMIYVRKKALISSLYRKVETVVNNVNSGNLPPTFSLKTAQTGVKIKLMFPTLPTTSEAVTVVELKRTKKSASKKLDRIFHPELITNEGTVNSPVYRMTPQLYKALEDSDVTTDSMVAASISTSCRIVNPGQPSAILYGTQSYTLGSSVMPRERFDCFQLEGFPEEVFRFVGSVRTSPADGRLLAVVKRLLPSSGNAYFCKLRKLWVTAEWFKYTRYEEDPELMVVDMSGFCKKVWMVKSFDHAERYHLFECH